MPYRLVRIEQTLIDNVKLLSLSTLPLFSYSAHFHNSKESTASVFIRKRHSSGNDNSTRPKLEGQRCDSQEVSRRGENG